MTRSQIFKEAWRIAKIAHKSYGYWGSVNQYFKESLRLSYKYKGKVPFMSNTETNRMLKCLSMGCKVIKWTSEYISENETKIIAETLWNREIYNNQYYFKHNKALLIPIKN